MPMIKRETDAKPGRVVEAKPDTSFFFIILLSKISCSLAHGSFHTMNSVVYRSKDVIKSGGEWISSVIVENVAVAHPEVCFASYMSPSALLVAYCSLSHHTYALSEADAYVHEPKLSAYSRPKLDQPVTSSLELHLSSFRQT